MGLEGSLARTDTVLKRLPIRLKLLLLAGVPVIGALVLATLLARDAERQAESAAALGSIEDLAHLSAHMSALVHELSYERNELSLRLGEGTLAAPEVKARFVKTDTARRALESFLATRQVSSLPPRLARDLGAAQTKLDHLPAERQLATVGKQPIDELLAYYRDTNLSLISATAALSQLSDDGELMRAISALVTVLQIKERASQEQALLSHVFAIDNFPAGTFKELVTLTTQEADYVNVLKFNAGDAVNKRFTDLSRGPEFARTAELRATALDAQNDAFGIKPHEWSGAQSQKIERYRSLERELSQAVRDAAVSKMAAATRSVRLSYGLGAGVIVFSTLLAAWIARGILRSVKSLSATAERVRRDQDFAARARKTSEDELGELTDAFNEMLAGLQERDVELGHHRENLELLVEQRTADLKRRNEAMRVVLDNVGQGLATIRADGSLTGECSRAFGTWFGERAAEGSFADRLAPSNETLRGTMKLGWEQVAEGILPLEAAIDQLPRSIELGARHYEVDYRPIVTDDALEGALLVVSDVTDEFERRLRDREQRELLNVFERVMRDRAGFVEFFRECENLVQKLTTLELTEREPLMRALHTVKGNCALFGVTSVADICHALESELLESDGPPTDEQRAKLSASWSAFAERVRRLSASDEDPVVEVAYEELEELERASAARMPHAQLSELLERLKYERGVVRLRRIAEQARGLASRLGKGGLQVNVEAAVDVRFQAERWAPFWSSFVHIVRNALDHGIEAPDTRLALGKPAHGTLALRAKVEGQRLALDIEDDGRGIDWERVRERARARDLPHASALDLENALFTDGVSTAAGVSELSGRGVGLGAVRDATRALGGTVTISSSLGRGSTIRFRFPFAEANRVNPASRHPGARPSLSAPEAETAKPPSKITAA